MAGITPEEAIHSARTTLGLEESIRGRAWLVRRLDPPSANYYLVELGDPGASVAIATVDANSGEVGAYAHLPGVRSHIAVDARLATELAAGGEVAQAELVWRPCRASKSPLYPLWEVRTPQGTRYVDQGGNVFDTLEPASPGGG